MTASVAATAPARAARLGCGVSLLSDLAGALAPQDAEAVADLIAEGDDGRFHVVDARAARDLVIDLLSEGRIPRDALLRAADEMIVLSLDGADAPDGLDRALWARMCRGYAAALEAHAKSPRRDGPDDVLMSWATRVFTA